MSSFRISFCTVLYKLVLFFFSAIFILIHEAYTVAALRHIGVFDFIGISNAVMYVTYVCHLSSIAHSLYFPFVKFAFVFKHTYIVSFISISKGQSIENFH